LWRWVSPGSFEPPAAPARSTAAGAWQALRALAWVGQQLSGRRRLFALAMVPVLRRVIIVLAIGFAMKDYVSSLIAGIVAVGEMPYRNGDWIEVQGRHGEVRHVGMRAVQIVTPDDTLMTIPHQVLWTEAVRRANDGDARLMCVANGYLAPGHDAAQVRASWHDVTLTSAYLHTHGKAALIAAGLHLSRAVPAAGKG
jgi:small conductance mechanosensitive channel